MAVSLEHRKRMLAHLEQQQAAQAGLAGEAHRALTELRRVRDLFAQRGDAGEAGRINVRVKALKTAIG